ncbi:MAG: hypothetical protein VKL98_09125 [Cyanobacteriota bacterium]|nr:hypothetical protein [Cyanobacteriota bacterium]
MASLTIRPGSRVRLKGQDHHVPDFLVVGCSHHHCWLRQQNWHPQARLMVTFSQLLVGEAPAVPQAPAGPADNVICLATYRQRRAR